MHANVATSLPWLSQMITDVTIDKRQGVMMLTHPDGTPFMICSEIRCVSCVETTMFQGNGD